jgi:predicted dehydrogenase
MMHCSRRTFLGTAAATALLPGIHARGSNDDVRVAVIGIRGKGAQHIEMFSKVPGVRVVALCDPDRAVLDARGEKFGISAGQRHTDLRRVLDSHEIDAVVIATPNHWHALATIWACQAGKDVYVEKPCSYDLWEGRQMIAAARKYDRIVQVGTQRRSDQGLRAGFQAIRDGELGKILRTRLVIFRRRQSIGRVAPHQPPSSVDYNLWAGPAPMSPITRAEFHYDWHWFWETGNGELGNNGPHVLDLARWVNGYDKLPPRVLSFGGRYGWDDAGQTPNTHVAFYDYQPAPILIEIRNLPENSGSRTSDHYKGTREGIVVECEHGYYVGLDGGAFYDNEGKRIRPIDGDGGRHHPATFIQAVRSHRVEDLTCDIAEGHLSTALCHVGNISYQVGRTVSPVEARQRVQSDGLALEALDRMAGHLQANGVELDAHKLTLGPALAIDTATEQFTGDYAEAANALRRRVYRDPFVVPEQV